MTKEAVEINGKVWTKDNLKELLLTNNNAVERAITVIYGYQTLSEQAENQTVSANGVGFNQFDSALLSSFAQQLEEGKHLSYKQMIIARKKITKYAGQLLKHMKYQQENKWEEAFDEYKKCYKNVTIYK